MASPHVERERGPPPAVATRDHDEPAPMSLAAFSSPPPVAGAGARRPSGQRGGAGGDAAGAAAAASTGDGMPTLDMTAFLSAGDGHAGSTRGVAPPGAPPAPAAAAAGGSTAMLGRVMRFMPGTTGGVAGKK